jgi:hypothetical protein
MIRNPQNEPVDVALDDSRAPGQGEAVEDGVVVVFQAVGEGVPVGLVVCLDGGDSVIEAVSVQAGEDLGELGDVPGEGVQVGAAFPGPVEPGFLVVIEGVRVLEDPAGQVAGLGQAGTAGGAAPAFRNGWT